MMKKGKTLVALLCLFSFGCASSPQQASKDMADKIIAESNQVTQQHIASPQDLVAIAANLERYVALAEKDGTLAKSEASIRRDAIMDKMKPEGRQALQRQNLKALMLEAAQNMRDIAALTPAARLSGAHLITAAWRDSSPTARVIPAARYWQCGTYEGSFLAIAAIGAMASLGGVNPLGDLLGAIGAVGAFGTWVICNQ